MHLRLELAIQSGTWSSLICFCGRNKLVVSSCVDDVGQRTEKQALLHMVVESRVEVRRKGDHLATT
jgi:hypothetical protein